MSWIVDRKRNLTSWAVLDGKKVIANLKFQGASDYFSQLKNAYLVSAAPELYSSLQEILDSFDIEQIAFNSPKRNAFDKALLALAKARGQYE